MLAPLPEKIQDFMDWSWPQIEPYYAALAARALSADTLTQWMLDWTRLSELLDEIKWRLYVETTRHTDDQGIQERYSKFLKDLYPLTQPREQELKEKLLDSKLVPAGCEVPLRAMRAQADLYCESNVPLLAEEAQLVPAYDEIVGAQTAQWDGEEIPLTRLTRVFQETDRRRRELAWRKRTERQLADREAIMSLWSKLLAVRRQLAVNAACADYRAYRWRQMQRFDYTPDDTRRYAQAVADLIVPVTTRLAERRRQQLGLQTLRPWDMSVDPLSRPPLKPFNTVEELESKAAGIFQQLDPQLGAYFETMRREGLLDLENRKGKGPGFYCQTLSASRRPFVFCNAVGIHYDVVGLMHESGHAFHVFETNALPYLQQRQEQAIPAEFAEVASHSMELLTIPYLLAEKGGFYSKQDYQRAVIQHLESILGLLSEVAIREAFQHWVYDHPDAALDWVQCDAKWAELNGRFTPFVDWSGLEDAKGAGWRNILHIIQIPFYNMEYAMAQLGAIQVWANSLRDPADALRHYRHALSLGGSATLPDLYKAAGAKLAFDADTLKSSISLIENTLSELDAEGQ